MKTTTQGHEWRWLAREMKPFALSHSVSLSMFLVASVLTAIDPLILKWLIDSGLRRGAMLPIVYAAGAFGTIYVARIALMTTGSYRLNRTVLYAMLRLRQRLLAKLHSMNAAFFDSHAVGDLVSRLEHEVEQLGDAAAELLPSLLRITVMIVTTFGVMLFLNARLALLTVPLLAALGLLRGWFAPQLQAASLRGQGAIGERSGFAAEAIGASIELQLLGAQRHSERRYGKLAVNAVRTSLAQARTELRYSGTAGLIMTACSALLLLATAMESVRGRMTIGAFIAFYTYVTRLFEPLSAAVATYVRLKRAGGSISRITEIERVPQTRVTPEHLPAIPHGTVTELECSALAFGYPSGPPLLERVDLQIRKGEKLALIGRSGSGKSTLARVLAGVYDGDAGSVRVNGIDVRQLHERNRRDLVSLVSAKPVIFRGTIRENVLLGMKLSDASELDRLAHLACFDSVVDRLEDGWDHRVGADGSGLSDGEKQRLAILRALVRNRDVLILDESTGALDSRTEAILLRRLEAYADGRLLLTITHRKQAEQWADRVVVLEDGTIKERGDASPQAGDPDRLSLVVS